MQVPACFANILIFIVLTDSREPGGIIFENLEFFRFLRGPNGGLPQKILIFFFHLKLSNPEIIKVK